MDYSETPDLAISPEDSASVTADLPKPGLTNASAQAVGKNAVATQQAISAPFNQPLSNPQMIKTPFDVVFGHGSNPNPSAGMPSFALPPMPQEASMAPIQSPGGAQLAPVAMAPTPQTTPNFQLTSDMRAKKEIKPAGRDLNDFFTQLYRIR